MSRLDNLGEILDDYDKRKVDAEAFKRENPTYEEWLAKLEPAERVKVSKLVSLISKYAVQRTYGPPGSPYNRGVFLNTALYVVGSSVTKEKYNDIDIVLVGMKAEYLTDEVIKRFTDIMKQINKSEDKTIVNVQNQTIYHSHPATRIKDEDSETKPIDFLIDRDDMSIKDWEYQQAAANERYVSIKRLDEKTKGGLDAFA